ncbi:MAG: hypothetical protein HYY20_12510 [Candidatus Tectomicrobia bacterium]|uniref:Uncharacterized protein n=1 Tax=Tectimicrobiota bacterium TaxID=2528274 RepID=A0A932FXL4_UNCTE|nr:hypothetical protein [Candidatus Tectomicrobia bacterium]
MKCPKCGYVSFNYLDTCKKCGRDLTAFKAEYGLWGVKPGNLSIYSPVPQAMGQEGSHGTSEAGALSDLEDDLSHEIEMIGEAEAAFQNPLLQGSQEELGEIRLDIEEIGLEEGEIDLVSPDKEETAVELAEEETTIELPEEAAAMELPEEREIDLDSPDNEAFALELAEEETVFELSEEAPAIRLEEIRLEEAEEGGQPEDSSGWLPLGEDAPSEVPSLEEAPEEVSTIDLELEEIDLGGVDLAEAEPVLDLGEENKPDLLDLDEIELSWEEEDSEKEEER